MDKLYLTRYAQSRFGALGNYSIQQMLADAGSEGLDGIDREAIGYISVAGLLTPMINDQCLLAGLIALDPAYTGKSIFEVGNACDSGGMAIINCATQILSGQAHIGMAIGLEKMHPLEGKLDSKVVGQALSTAAHPDDRSGSFSFPYVFAKLMALYMKSYGYTEEDFAQLPPIFYASAAHNDLAQMQAKQLKRPVTPEAVMSSYRLFDTDQGAPETLPLKLFECSQVSDGWARILVCDEIGLTTLGIPKEEATVLAGWGHCVDGLSLASRGENLLKPQGARKAFELATRMGRVPPDAIDMLEVHDCFSVAAAMALEITGHADAGQGLRYFIDGKATIDGECPVNTSGGLIAKGHPIGATGVAMAGWVNRQLLKQAPIELQVPDCENGVTLNIGGPFASTVCLAQYRA